MIGIFALTGWSPFELTDYANKISHRMASNPSWDINIAATNKIACGRVGPKRNETVWSSEDGLQKAWLDGFAYMLSAQGSATDRCVGAADLAKAILYGGPEALLDFQGEFFILVVDYSKQKLFAVNDRFGIRTTYWSFEAKRLIISSELGPLIHLGLVKCELDKPFIAALLRYNKCRLGNSTIFSGIQVMPPATILEYDIHQHQNPRHNIYYTHEFHNKQKTEDEWIETISPVLKNAVHVTLNTNNGSTALALSGGLDSRIILAALDEDTRQKPYLISFGLSNSDEVNLAAKVAKCVHGNYHNVKLDASDFIKWAQTSIHRNEEFDIFVQGANAALHKEATTTATALMTGWDIDIPLRGTYLDPDALSLQNQQQVVEHIEKKWCLFSEAELSKLLHEKFYSEVAKIPDEWLNDLLSQINTDSPIRQYLQFIFQFEKRRLLMLRNRMIRFELESLTPFYNTRLQMLLSGIPETMKLDNRLFAKFFNVLAPDLAEIPYQRTMLPVSVPVQYWNRSSMLEHQRESLLREIFINTEIQIPYTRYYSNFDEWILTNSEWHSFIEELLNSKKTIITQEFINPNILNDLIHQHKKGIKSQHTKLIYLLSLELYLRTYFC